MTFDIDANGIVNVSAKDLGTGKEQHITITSSTNMSKEEVEKAVKEAEQFAAEDKKQREAADIRNQADQMVFQTERTLEEMGDKIDAGDKSSVESALNKLKETMKGTDTQAIKDATEELTKAFYAVSEKLYQQQGQQAGQSGPTRAPTSAAAPVALPRAAIPMWWTPTMRLWTTTTTRSDTRDSGAAARRLRYPVNSRTEARHSGFGEERRSKEAGEVFRPGGKRSRADFATTNGRTKTRLL